MYLLFRAISSFVESTLLLHLYLFGEFIDVWLKGNYHVGSGEKKCLHNLVDHYLEYLLLVNCLEI